MESSSTPLAPTFVGHVSTTPDATVLVEAVLRGHLSPAPRRPHDRERPDLIKSGSVFIYEEHASGIKRWTDGVSWSPSRILGNFLIYRELDRPFPPGEKKRALKKTKKKSPVGIVKQEPPTHANIPYGATAGHIVPPNDSDQERSLVGSLTDSYDFKPNGLMKKTISFTYQGVPHHLVSYYNVKDVLSGKLATPSECESLRDIIPRGELLFSQSFRAPIEEVQYVVPDDNNLAAGGSQLPPGGNGIIHRAMVHGNMVHGGMVHGNMVHGNMVHGNMVHGNMPPSNMTHGSMAHGNMAHGNIGHGNMTHRDVPVVQSANYGFFPPVHAASGGGYANSLLPFHYHTAQQTPYAANQQGNYAPEPTGNSMGHPYELENHSTSWGFESPNADPHSQWAT